MKARFSQKASTYNQAAIIQKESAELLIKKIIEFKPVLERVSDLGCGTGLIPQILLQHFPEVSIDCCDISPEMLAILSATLNTHSKITTHLCSEPPEQNYDLVTANFSLQWFPSIKTTVQRCLNSLRPEGLLAISLPIEGTFKSLKDAIDTTQVNISLPKLPTESQVLEAFPLNSKLHIETIELYDNYPNTLAFLKGLHKIGAIEEGAKTATSDLRALIKQHDKLFPESISVNYKILQVIYKR